MCTSLFLFVNKQLCYSRQNKNFSIYFFTFTYYSIEYKCQSKKPTSKKLNATNKIIINQK